MTAIELRQRKAYIAEVRARIALLSPGWREPALARSQVRTQGGVVATKDGHPLAKFQNEDDRYFFADAVTLLQNLADTIEELQDELRDARAERRSYNVLTNHLLQAQRAGFTSKEGQKRVRDAHAEALDPTPNKEWDW